MEALHGSNEAPWNHLDPLTLDRCREPVNELRKHRVQPRVEWMTGRDWEVGNGKPLRALLARALSYNHRHGSRCMIPPALVAMDFSPTFITRRSSILDNLQGRESCQ